MSCLLRENSRASVPLIWVMRTGSAVFLCGFLSLGFSGCGGDEGGSGSQSSGLVSGSSAERSFPAPAWEGFPLLPDGRFAISGWCAPPINQTSVTRYREYAAAGFTLVLPALEDPYLVESNLERLGAAAEADLYVMVRDDRVHPDEATRDGWQSRVDSTIAVYGDYPGLVSYFLADEPAPQVFPSLAAITERFAHSDPMRATYVNLLGLSAAMNGPHGMSYSAYLQSFLETVQPAFYSMDLYTLTENGDSPNFCAGLDTTRTLSNQYDIPFWAVLQLTPHRSFRDLSKAELRWQANLALAYGASGIVWFTYWTPRPDSWNYRDGPITYDGGQSASYPRVAAVNREIAVLGRELAGYRSINVLHSGNLPADGVAIPEGSVVSVGEGTDLSFGLFVSREPGANGEPGENGNSGESGEPAPQLARMLVVNRDYENPVETEFVARIELSRWNVAMETYQRLPHPPGNSEYRVPLSLPPGGAALFAVNPN